MSTDVRFDIDCIKSSFAELPDPRSWINRRHELIDLVVICIFAVVAGADGPAGIAIWAKLNQVWLKQHLTLENGIPSRDTFRRFLSLVRPAAFQRCFAAWLKSLIGETEIKLLSIDGKTLRRSHDKKHNLGPLHLVSVWAGDQRLTLGQVATSEKSNEITAIPQVLEIVDVRGAIVTIDAMGCQRAIAKQIVDQGGDYLLPVKGNQQGLEQAVQAYFDDHLDDDFARVEVSRYEVNEKSHGRLEHRCYFQIDVPDTFARRSEWVGLKTFGLAIRTRTINGQQTGEVQGYISSLARDAPLFARASRGHWGIENICHWSLDMTFREDESRARDRCVAENLAWLRRFTLGLLKQHPNQKLSLAMKRRAAGWSTDFLSEILFPHRS
jgi:predicted transposase YbfD/YdcC